MKAESNFSNEYGRWPTMQHTWTFTSVELRRGAMYGTTPASITICIWSFPPSVRYDNAHTVSTRIYHTQNNNSMPSHFTDDYNVTPNFHIYWKFILHLKDTQWIHSAAKPEKSQQVNWLNFIRYYINVI